MLEHLLIALALAMDCFTVSVVCGVVVRKNQAPLMLKLAFLFGFFQALMPMIGWLLTSSFQSYLESFDHWVAFGMLAFIGGKMIVESFGEEESKSINPSHFRTRISLAIATSIDALAVGITYACSGYNSLGSLAIPLSMIGLVSFVLSICGFVMGVKFGNGIVKKVHPELLGGLVLLGIGVKILIEHLS